MANKHKKNKRTLDIPKEITDALSVPPIEYLRKWWLANSTDEERKAMPERVKVAVDAIRSFVSVGAAMTMNTFNKK